MIPNAAEIWDKEVRVTTSRSSGPGGQAVNKLETKVHCSWNVLESILIEEEEVGLILRRLSHYATKSGSIVMSCQESRSQAKNRELLRSKFIRSIQKAFEKPKSRRATKVPFRSKQKRRLEKKRRSEIKKGRQKPGLNE